LVVGVFGRWGAGRGGEKKVEKKGGGGGVVPVV